jgi:hypothetical protein
LLFSFFHSIFICYKITKILQNLTKTKFKMQNLYSSHNHITSNFSISIYFVNELIKMPLHCSNTITPFKISWYFWSIQYIVCDRIGTLESFKTILFLKCIKKMEMDKLPLESDKYLLAAGLCMPKILGKRIYHFSEHYKAFHMEFWMVFSCTRYLAIDTPRHRAKKQNKEIFFSIFA